MPNPKLSDIQFILLVTASRRPEGNLLPWPRSLTAHADQIPAEVSSLLRRKLVEEVEVETSRRARRSKGGKQLGLTITDAGRATVKVETGGEGDAHPPSPAEPVSAGDQPLNVGRSGTKLALVIKMLKQKNGATAAELMAATGWLPHTTRAALCRLRKKGHAVVTDRVDDATRYRISRGA